MAITLHGAQLIYSLRFSDHISDAVVSLHWLQSPERVMFKVADVQSHTWINTNLPESTGHVADLPGRHSLRSTCSIRELVPSIRLVYCRRPGIPCQPASYWKPISTLSPSLATSWTVVPEVISITWTSWLSVLLDHTPTRRQSDYLQMCFSSSIIQFLAVPMHRWIRSRSHYCHRKWCIVSSKLILGFHLSLKVLEIWCLEMC